MISDRNDPRMSKLITLLEEAANLISEFTGGYSNQFSSAEEFHEALVESIEKLKNGDETQLKILVSWFYPTSSWDEFIGYPGMDLANKISEMLEQNLNS